MRKYDELICYFEKNEIIIPPVFMPVFILQI